MSMPPFTVIIPARLASTRLPNKPLADIGGAPMIVRVAEQATKSSANRIVVATDAQEVQNVCMAHNIEVVMTRTDHPTGTDRLSEVASQLELPEDAIVVNVQGDEPFIPPTLIDQVALSLASHPQCAIATAAVAIHDPVEIHNPNAVKVVLRNDGRALYFSRASIPFQRDVTTPLPNGENFYRHIGIYAYKVHFLNAFAALSPAPIEKIEALEQLRALWNGYAIQVHITKEVPPPGVDTPEDLAFAQQEWQKLQ